MYISSLWKKEKLSICSFIILAILLLFHLVNNYIVLSLDNTLPIYDEWNRAEGAYGISMDLKGLNYKNIQLNEIYNRYCQLGDKCRPPLYEITLSLYFFIQKNINADNITMLNMFYFAIILISVYGIGLKLKDKATGLLAAFIVSMFPAIFAMSRGLMVDFPLTAMVSLSIYLMLLTRHFLSIRYSLFLGVGIGLGLLTKATYIVFILPPLIYYIFIALKKTFKEKEQFVVIFRNFIMSLLTSLLIAGPWYLPNMDKIINRANAMSLQLSASPHGSFIDFYIRSLFSYSIGPFFLALFLIFSFVCLVNKKGGVLAIWLFLPLLFFSFSQNKTPRFILPLLPPIALLIGLGISLIKSYLIKKRVTFFVVVFSFITYLAISYGTLNHFKICPFYPKERFFPPDDRVTYGLYFPYCGQTSGWNMEEISNIFLNNMEMNKNKYIGILCIFNIGRIHNSLDYYLTSKGIVAHVCCPAAADFFDSAPRDGYDNISEFDFVITKDEDVGMNGGSIAWIERLTANFEKHKEEFYLVEQIKNSSGKACIYIYKRKGINEKSIELF